MLPVQLTLQRDRHLNLNSDLPADSAHPSPPSYSPPPHLLSFHLATTCSAPNSTFPIHCPQRHRVVATNASSSLRSHPPSHTSHTTPPEKHYFEFYFYLFIFPNTSHMVPSRHYLTPSSLPFRHQQWKQENTMRNRSTSPFVFFFFFFQRHGSNVLRKACQRHASPYTVITSNLHLATPHGITPLIYYNKYHIHHDVRGVLTRGTKRKNVQKGKRIVPPRVFEYPALGVGKDTAIRATSCQLRHSRFHFSISYFYFCLVVYVAEPLLEPLWPCVGLDRVTPAPTSARPPSRCALDRGGTRSVMNDFAASFRT